MTSTDCLVPSRPCRSYDSPCKPRGFIQTGTCVGVPWLIITVSGLDDWMYWHWDFLSTINHNNSQSTTNSRAIPYWRGVFFLALTKLVLIYESVTSSASLIRWLTLNSWESNYSTAVWILFTNEWINEFLVLLSTATALSSTALQMSPF
jgi:hypothetical protein